MGEILKEYFVPERCHIKVDRTRNTIHGVKILGVMSRNKRRYPIETLIKAIPLYENAKVNVDHPVGEPGRPRSYSDRIGTIKSVDVKNKDGLYADFHYNPSHPLSEQLLWDAEHSPENVGFSHNVEAVLKHDENGAIVDKILAVRSVDLVADPATTCGLFESEMLEAGGIVVKPNENEIQSLSEALNRKDQEMNFVSFKSREMQKLYENILSRERQNSAMIENLFHKQFFEVLHECRDETMFQRIVDERMNLLERLENHACSTSEFPRSRSQELFSQAPRAISNGHEKSVTSFVRDITR